MVHDSSQEKMIQERIERARELIRTVRHVPVSTINEDGSPLSSPVFSTLDSTLNLYWASNADAQHSNNIRRDERVFLVLFDSMEKGGGLYIEARAHEISNVAELDMALMVVNKKRTALGRAEVGAGDFSSDAIQRLYCAVPQKLWVNVSRHDTEGRVVSDQRHEITLGDLI